MIPPKNKSPMLAIAIKPGGEPKPEASNGMADEMMEEKPTMPEFMAPAGFEVPEGTEPGAEFQAVATLRAEADGTLVLISLDGAEFTGAGEEAGETMEEPVEEEASEEVVETPGGGDIASFQDEIEQQQKKMKGR